MLSSTAASCAMSSPSPTNSTGKSGRQNGAPRPPTPFMKSGGSVAPGAGDSAASARSTSIATRSRSQSSALPAPLTVPSWACSTPLASAHSTLRSSPSGSDASPGATRCTNAPVPTLTSAERGSGRPNAKAAADWSPVQIVSGIDCAPTRSGPKACRVATQLGRCRRSIPNRPSRVSDQSSVAGSYSSVRDAFAGSTVQGRPGTSRASRKLDSGPAASCPSAAAPRTAGSWSRHQRSLLAP